MLVYVVRWWRPGAALLAALLAAGVSGCSAPPARTTGVVVAAARSIELPRRPVTKRVVPAGPVEPVPGCRPASTTLQRGEREHTVLRRSAGGPVRLLVEPMPPAQRPDAGHVGTWHPAQPLPAPETHGHPLEIFYTPHPDDETLSMAPLITRAAAAGTRVIVVAMTDGTTTGAIRLVNERLAKSGRPAKGGFAPLTRAQIGQARDLELRRAARALGVAPGDVYFAHLDARTSDCGTAVSVGEARDVMTAMAKRFPGATHVTMSFAAERNTDHLACGFALRDLARARVVSDARWTVSRLWWSLQSPPSSWVLPGTRSERARIASAVAAYGLWDPAHLSYAIGMASVRPQFVAEELDPRARVHRGT